MPELYPSWIEIPVDDLDRARDFYCAVFGLGATHQYTMPPATEIIVLLPSDKAQRGPGVSLVRAPSHQPARGGIQVNFHVGAHADLEAALAAAQEFGVATGIVIAEDDGVRYVTLHDSEGNPIALSSYEAV